METILNGQFKLLHKLGAGSFGEIYSAIIIETKEEVAIKMESSKTKQPLLKFEAKLMQHLASEGIPEVYWYGVEGDKTIMVMELLGHSLEDLLEYCDKKFTLKTTILIGLEILDRIETVHSKNFIHRDVKPANFLIGLKDKSKMVYIIDFGLARRFRDDNTNQHIEIKNNCSLTGTARYASVNAHQGVDQSRRDDLESMFYTLIYMLNGKLPWQGMNARHRTDKYHRILELKMTTPSDKLCLGFPDEMITIFKYIKSLKFETDPNYQFIRSLFLKMYEDKGFATDKMYDWVKKQITEEKNNPYLFLKNFHAKNQLKKKVVKLEENDSILALNDENDQAYTRQLSNLPSPSNKKSNAKFFNIEKNIQAQQNNQNNEDVNDNSCSCYLL